MNAKRGHESTEHLQMKIRIGELFINDGYTVFYEQLDCDVLVINRSTKQLTAIEIESTPKSVRRNIKKDARNGCHAIAIISLNQKFHSQISTKAQTVKDLSIPIKIFHHNQTSHLLSWVHTLTNNKQP